MIDAEESGDTLSITWQRTVFAWKKRKHEPHFVSSHWQWLEAL